MDITCRVARAPLHLVGLDKNLWWNQMGSQLDLSILEYGLKFIPSSTRITQDENRIFKFISGYRSSNYNLNIQNAKVDMIKGACHLVKTVSSNISKKQRETLKTLKDNESIIVKNADKNLGVTIMDITWYKTQIELHLSQYRKVPAFPFKTIKNKVKRLLLDKKINIEKDTWSKPCPFYLIPKVHKSPISSRPISVASNYITSPLSKQVCVLLNGIVKTKEAIISSSLEFVNRVHGKQSLINIAGSRVFTADVESLYPSIDVEHSIALLSPMLLAHKANSLFIEAVKVVLRNHYVTYDNVIYKQTNGIAMGTPMAPPWASLYMLALETNIISTFPEVIWYVRYIDDYIGFWNGSDERFSIFIDKMNLLHPSIKIKFTELTNSAAFLDIFIFKKEERWESRLYRKDLNITGQEAQ